jgi:hypothetical protein
LEKTIKIKSALLDEKGNPKILPVKFKATANVPRMYRIWFRRDIIKDMQHLKKSAKESKKNNKEFTIEDLSIFENVAYCMARLADLENTPNSIDKWLDGFATFSIYEILPQILELWEMNLETTSQAKKKQNKLTAR